MQFVDHSIMIFHTGFVFWPCVYVCSLTQQEQALAQSQVRCLPPERGGSETKTVDIIKMLTNAQTDYEKVRF